MARRLPVGEQSAALILAAALAEVSVSDTAWTLTTSSHHIIRCKPMIKHSKRTDLNARRTGMANEKFLFDIGESFLLK